MWLLPRPLLSQTSPCMFPTSSSHSSGVSSHSTWRSGKSRLRGRGEGMGRLEAWAAADAGASALAPVAALGWDIVHQDRQAGRQPHLRELRGVLRRARCWVLFVRAKRTVPHKPVLPGCRLRQRFLTLHGQLGLRLRKGSVTG